LRDPSVVDVPVYQRWRSKMAQRELLPDTLKSSAAALILFTFLGTAGCMTRRQAVTSTAGDVVTTIDPAELARDKCEDFGCER
jgi:hypothetical protein